jgi:hypothetical protein
VQMFLVWLLRLPVPAQWTSKEICTLFCFIPWILCMCSDYYLSLICYSQVSYI